MKQYNDFDEWEKDKTVESIRGFLLAFFICSIFWGFVLVAGCKTVKAATSIDMNKIKMIESSGNPSAHNKSEDAIGLYQITPIVLKEWNNFHPNIKFTREQLFDSSVNLTIAAWYMHKRIPQMLRHYKIADTVDNRLIAYNAGIAYLVNKKPLPKITKRYIEKYNEEIIYEK